MARVACGLAINQINENGAKMKANKNNTKAIRGIRINSAQQFLSFSQSLNLSYSLFCESEMWFAVYVVATDDI